MEHDGIFNHLRRRLASEGHLADTPSRGMCLHCRSAHLGEYTCHVALIINTRMCQLPPGDGEGSSRQVGPEGRFFGASRRPRSPPSKSGGRPGRPPALPRQIFKGGQIGLSSVERGGHPERRATPPLSHTCAAVAV